MRTTVNLDDDVLAAVKDLAAQQGRPVGDVLSDLVRRALAPSPGGQLRNGVPLLTPIPGAPKPTMELVNRLRDEE